ncbi:PepSY domain-containing protein [Alteromonas abrolhosensis]|uniref:PepSY domain-containing protein n=1 Tax=Alteromonas abrolhosensis TaxID=1892904 RepID=UPI00096B94E7|nr:PepSY domain-containing protein [Alteromonas abrolhosensis]MEC9060526.1 PepSY domain-containing protein [Pseudomonadota bacterium]|tara:strand:- start:1637 stop:2173 length:537 start_codon:yes stop_codon:yes gene_type:complete
MSVSFRKYSRSIHLWLSLVIFIPVIIVIASGLLLQVKKEFDWIQPPTQKAQNSRPTLSFDNVLNAVRQVPQANLNDWDDIDRLDVRPAKGIIKVRGKNHWEVQLNAQTGDVLQVAYRRTDTIEAIHDGSWFFDGAKLWLFLPAAILLFVLWVTGIVMLITTLKSKYRKNKYQQSFRNS